MKWEIESELALKAATEAGSLLTDVLIQNISEKANHKDIITEYDLATGRKINQIISSQSKYPIINEEMIESVPKNLEDIKTYWVVDPIDGTTNFSSGMALYACAVGLVNNNEFVTGTVYAPKTKELYFTYGDQGSYLNGKLIQSKKNVDLKNASVVASFSNSFSKTDFHARQYDAFGEINDKSRTLLRLGSAALNISYVSDGRLHGAYGLNAKVWDIGASLAIAKQAGCVLFYEFTDSITLNYIVGSSSVVEEIKAILKKKGLING